MKTGCEPGMLIYEQALNHVALCRRVNTSRGSFMKNRFFSKRASLSALFIAATLALSCAGISNAGPPVPPGLPAPPNVGVHVNVGAPPPSRVIVRERDYRRGRGYHRGHYYRHGHRGYYYRHGHRVYPHHRPYHKRHRYGY